MRNARLKQNLNESPFWMADIEVWREKTQAWMRTFRSTKVLIEAATKAKADRQRKEALGIAQEMQRLAEEATTVPRGISREWARKSVDSLLRAAGARPTGKQVKWHHFRDAWLRTTKAAVGERTYEAYASHLKTFTQEMEPPAESVLDHFDLDVIQAWYDVAANERSPKTTNNILKTVAMVFQDAVSKQHLTQNPCEGVRRRHAEDVVREREPFTTGEIDQMLKACPEVEHGEEWVTMILVAMTTGAREGDCATMGRPHLDMSAEPWCLRFRMSKLRGKGAKGMVNPPVVEPLRSHLEALLKSSDSLLFCPNLSTLPVGGRKGLSARFREIMDLAKLHVRVIAAQGCKGRPWRDKGFHSFRHTLPGWLAAHGVDERLAMAIVGHSSKAVHRGYTHHDMRLVATKVEAAVKRGKAG